MSRESRSDGSSEYARLIGVGFSFLIIVALLCGGGLLADRWLGTLPLFMLVGLVLGFLAGLYYIYLAIKKMDNG